MGFREFLGRFRGDERGAIAIWAGLGLPMIFGFGALAIDMNSMYRTKAQLQHTADAAAIAAVKALPDVNAAITAAQNYANLNMPSSFHGNVVSANDVVTGNWEAGSRTFTPGGSPVNAVSVAARRAAQNSNPLSTLLASAIGFDSVDASASTIAATSGGGGADPLCILALDPSASKAVEVNSNAQITASNCNIHVNSDNSSDALYTDSNAIITVYAGSVCVVGDYQSQSNSDIDPAPTTDCDPLADPLAGLPAPSAGSCDHNSLELDNSSATLMPGVYCGGLTIKGNSNVTLASGTYIIKGDKFFVDSNSNLTGSGVFIYMADGAYIDFDSNTTITLSAPASGDYQGILFFAEDGNDLTHYLDSNNVSTFDGSIYVPGDKLEVNSNAQVSNGSSFTWMIAKTFYLDSNAHVQVDPSGATVTPPAMAGGGGTFAIVK